MPRYYRNAIKWSLNCDLMYGYSERLFGPNDCMTREQLATALIRYLDRFLRLHFYIDAEKYDRYTGVDAGSFDDSARISPYAIEPVGRALMYGIITGKTETILDPQGEVTRAEAAVMISRLLELIDELVLWRLDNWSFAPEKP